MTAPKTINLDAQLGFDAAPDAPKFTKKVELLGREWTVVCDLSAFGATNMMGSGDASGVMDFLRSLILPEEWPEFARIASQHPALRGETGSENLMKLINALTEVAGERPTKPSSTLPPGGSRRTSSPKSAASSSVKRAARSTR